MPDNPLHHLGDAVIISILLVATLAGAPLWLVFSVYLALDLFTKLAKAFSAWARPIVEAVKGRST